MLFWATGCGDVKAVANAMARAFRKGGVDGVIEMLMRMFGVQSGTLNIHLDGDDTVISFACKLQKQIFEE